MNNIEQLREMLMSEDKEIAVLAVSILRPVLECCKRHFTIYRYQMIESMTGYPLMTWLEWYAYESKAYKEQSDICKCIINKCLEVYKEITE